MPVFYNYSENYEKISSRFEVFCGNTKLGVYDCDVSAVPFNQVWPGYQRPFEQTEPTSYLSVGSNEEITLKITPNTEFKEVVVRPLSKGVVADVKDGSVTVTLPGAGQYSVEFDGMHNVLSVFVNPEKEFDVDADDENTLYFGAGVHYLEECVELEDYQTVYIDKHAVVYGGFKAREKKGLRILGYGVLDCSNIERGNGNPISLYRCENIIVEGITIVNSNGWSVHFAGCTNVKADNIKLIGMWRYNSDGCDFTNCTNGVLVNSYLRNYDDCIVIKGLGGNGHLPVRNFLAENCVLWCDWGRAIEIGAETSAPSFSGVMFKNIDIIHGDAVMMDIQHGDKANISDIYFDNIRAEYMAKVNCPKLQSAPGEVYKNEDENYMPLLFVVNTVRTMYSKDATTGNIKNVNFRNISVHTEDGRIPCSNIAAKAPDSCIEGVYFENIEINGKKYVSLDELNVELGDGTSDVTIK